MSSVFSPYFHKHDGTDSQKLSVAPQSPVTLTAHTSSEIPLTLVGASGQTADYLEIKNSSGTVLMNVASSGDVAMGAGSVASGGVLNVSPLATSQPSIVLKTVSGQTSNHLEVRNSSGTAVSLLDAFGGAIFGSSVGFGNGGTTAYSIVMESVSTVPVIGFKSQASDPLNSSTFGYLYVKNGALVYRGTSGTITQIAAA